MSRMVHSWSVRALIAFALWVPRTATAQTPIPAHVRVLTNSEQIMRWLGPQRDVILVVDKGTTLEVLDFDQDKDAYWVILPPDLHGTRKVGWIDGASVEAAASPAPDVAAPASYTALPLSPSDGQRDGAQTPAVDAPSTGARTAPEENVTISVRRDTPARGAADGAGAKKSFVFEDVHFERDQASIRSEDMDRLRAAAAALKADPSLVVTIEGHTCSLGPAPYNLELGNRRANAVKDYLVTAGVPGDRLRTVSEGERHAEYDNAREETRRLNRRVALVPRIQR